MKAEDVKIEAGWKEALRNEFESAYFDDLKMALKHRMQEGAKVLPPGQLIFNAFNSTPWEVVKVVILGQDPYHRIGQAMGLSFSVPRGVRTPPSLKNIYKEIQTDIGGEIPSHGDLSYWAEQGVLLLNAMLTVEEGKPGSHKNLGWQTFTNGVIQKISEVKSGVVFMLWGGFARAKKPLIDASKHHILEAAHPSPLARGAFFGSKHFSACNQLLEKQGQTAIDWIIKD